jgi:multidrug efflux pump subunit AcrB
MNRFNLSKWAIDNPSLVYFFACLLLVAGAWSYFTLGRSEDPDYTWKLMMVEARWPGATVDETLQQVTDKIEKKLQETPYLESLRSFTNAGRTTILVLLKDSTPPKSVSEAWYQVRKKLADIRHTLPPGVIGPEANDEAGDVYGIQYAFAANGFTPRELRDYVEGVRSTLLHLADVAKIDIYGAQDERIYIEFLVRRLADLHINPTELVRALQAQNAITPSGAVDTRDEQFMVRVSGRFTSEEDLRRINFFVDGRLIPITDIGVVKRTYADPPQPMFRVNGQPAIGMAIALRERGDTLALGRNVVRAMAQLTGDLPIGIEPVLITNQPEIVRHSVDEFMLALLEAVAIVMAVGLATLGLRGGTVVACSIPLVLASVFVVMDVTDIGLQRVSLGALIISLGLLVDDAIITVEAMISKLEEGLDKRAAAVYAYATTHFPMGTGTLVTIAAFLPVGFARSSAGEYTFSLFAIIAIALPVSWLVAAIFAPLIGVALLPVQHGKRDERKGSHPILRRFRVVLDHALRAPWLTVGLTLGLFACSLVALRAVPQQFFPASDRRDLMIDINLPQNSSITATAAATSRLDAMLLADPDIDHWSTYIGRGAERFYLSLNATLTHDFFAQLVIVTKSVDARERVRHRLEQALQERFPSLVGRVYPLELGPTVGWPLQYRVSGPDPGKVRELAHEVAQMAASNPYIKNVNFDWMEPVKTLDIKVDQDQARMLGISSELVSQAVNTVVSGTTINVLRDGIYLIDVVARASEQERLSVSTLSDIQIHLTDGRTVPLIQVATIGYRQEFPMVVRRNRLATLTVQGETAPGVQPQAVVDALAPKVAELNTRLPQGYRVDVGGSAEESVKAQQSVAAVIPLMLALILTILMVQLRSLQLLLLVLSVAPLGLIGVVAALLGSGRPLGFVALLGVVALIGMIVRNSVILIVQIEANIARGQAPWDAVLDAATTRFRPILLTAAAAILAMIPIAATVFWGPMAYAIMGGLSVATGLTLVFLPALYVIWFRVKAPPARAVAL